MFYRNLHMFRFPEAFTRDALVSATLEKTLSKAAVRPCGPLELNTRGWGPAISNDSHMFVHTVAHFAHIRLCGENKLLPASAVNVALAEKLRRVTETEARRVGARERKRLKDEVLTDMLPRALVTPYHLRGYVDRNGGWLVIDTASRRAAEEFLSHLREAIGTFPAVPMAPEESARALLTDWLTNRKLPKGFALGSECELRDPAESGAKWSGRNTDLESDDVLEHIKAGLQVFRLGLVFDDRLSFVLGEDLVIRKLNILDGPMEELSNADSDDATSEFDAHAALTSLEVERLLAALADAFGLHRPEAS